MSKHTPGPWEAFKGAGWCVRRENANACIKVGINPECDLVDSGDNQHCECEAKANAKLIAAAPDLLAALKVMVAVNAPCTPGSSDRDTWENEYSVWTSALEAIRKAEGN